jgi:hypothetical protein
MRPRVRWSFALALTLTVHSAPSRAEDAKSTGDGARAVEMGNQGIVFFEQGRWLEALERFKEAEAHYHSPVFSLYAARSLRNAGRLLEARDAFRRLAEETLPASAPAVWTQAQREGRSELATLAAEIPSVVISLLGASSSTVVLIDGRPVVPDRHVELEPGVHRVVATDAGRREVRDFTLARGARERVVMRLDARHDALPALTSTPAASNHTGGTSLLGWALLGTGGAAVATGAAFGVLALGRKAEAEDAMTARCTGNVCPASRRDEIEAHRADARKLGTIADVLLIGGAGVGLAGAGVLLFSSPAEPPIQAAMTGRGAVVRVRF